MQQVDLNQGAEKPGNQDAHGVPRQIFFFNSVK